MERIRSVKRAITSRKSRRKYHSKTIEPTDRKSIQKFIEENTTGPFGTKLRFELVSAAESDTKALKGLGTYGFIKNPPGFLIGATENSPHNLEDYGYGLEKIILKATELGLGTCWLGGSFTASSFAKKISATENETVPAVASIGYATSKTGTTERLIQWAAKARKRYHWDTLFFNELFSIPLSKNEAGKFATPLEMVRIGPSASNKQPWRFVKRSPAVFHLFLQRTEGYDRSLKLLKLADIQRIDMGIAMSHFEETCKEEGIEGKWTIEAMPSIPPLPERTEYVATFSASNI